jgi:hypothetical protein
MLPAMSEWIGIGALVVTILFIVVATPIVAWRAARFFRVRARGELSPATNLEVEEVRDMDNANVMAYRVTYMYADHHGVRHTGRSHLLMTDPRPALEGSTAMIRFDPAEPTRSVWIGPER